MTEGPEATQEARNVAKAELFELIVESASDFAIFTTDLDGLATSWNVGAKRLFGFAEEEMIGKTADILFTPEDRRAAKPEQERRDAIEKGRALDDRWHQRKDGSRFWASGLLMPLKGGDGYVKIARDRTEQHAADEKIRDNEQRFRVLATAIPQLVFRTRPSGERTWPSPQWIDFTGFGHQASLGLGWLDALHPDDRQGTLDAWAVAQQRGEYYYEHRVWHAANKEYRWHQTRARPVSDSGSDWVGTMTDIHELRGLQERQQVLMAELQHRTRNLLAVVQAIAAQTIRKSDSLDVFSEEFSGRLRALSRVQSLLARSDHRDIDLRDIVEAELAAHGDGQLETDKITVDGPRVALPAASAQAFGLGLHELATNALKYGALAQPAGRLEVNWRLETEGPQSVVALDWRESGVEMPKAKDEIEKGYGSELIERALPYQLKAKTKLEFGPDGVHCFIAAPVHAGSQD